MKRASGVLLPVFSLPSEYGCGSLGRAAYNFIDWLSKAKQSYWQMLPINHAGFGDSPYCCFSSFAGNPLFIDLDMLCEAGLISNEDINSVNWGSNPMQIDYKSVKEGRRLILGKAFESFKEKGLQEENDYRDFVSAESRWLNSYAEFMSCKEKQSEDYYRFLQFCFYTQWKALREYANSKGIKLIGDVPVYVPLDSADVKSEPQFFMLDEKNLPIDVAGVPPDYFNSEGQLWGNPLYNWDALKKDGYGWWIRRIDGTLRLFDMVRIDHFRGFDSYWAVPASEGRAKNGRWIKGPGMDFVGVINGWFGAEHFIAEDLGILTDSVRQMLKESGLPGMKVLEFAFTEDMTSAYLPHNYDHNCICYVGTHDNAPALEWAGEADTGDLKRACKYCGCTAEDINWGLIKIGMISIADTFIAQMQDILGLGIGSRTNTPGSIGGNWQWRMGKDALNNELAEKLAELTRLSGRA